MVAPSGKRDSDRWMLESVEIDKMEDVPINDETKNTATLKVSTNDNAAANIKKSGNLGISFKNEPKNSLPPASGVRKSGNVGIFFSGEHRSALPKASNNDFIRKSGNIGTSFKRTTSSIGASFRKTTSSALRRSGLLAPHPPRQKIERTASAAARGLKSLRFLDRTTTGKETDAWRSIERRFYQFAVDDRLPRDKFGVCIGKYDRQFLLKLLVQPESLNNFV